MIAGIIHLLCLSLIALPTITVNQLKEMSSCLLEFGLLPIALVSYGTEVSSNRDEVCMVNISHRGEFVTRKNQ